jgi:hypothetical protein
MIYQLPGGQWKTQSLGQDQVIQLPGGWWEKKATSGLYTPAAKPRLLLGADGAWHPMNGTPLPSLGAFGASVSAAPPGNWAAGATAEEFAAGFSMALGGITPDVRSQIAATNPELGIAIDGMSSIIEAVSNKEPGWPMAIEVARIVADVLVDLLSGKGSIGAIIQEAVQAAAQAIGASVSAVAAAIPFVGAFVQLVCRIIEVANRPSVTAQERAGMDERYRRYCRGFVTNWNVPGHEKGTDPFNAVSLADMFSQNDARAQLWRLLAGGASRNAGVRNSYNSWLSRAKGKYNITGIPLHVMRQMNEMMDGVFAARRDPNRPPGQAIVTDNGAGVGGILLHVTRDQMVLGAFNAGSCQSLADNFIAPGRSICVPAEYPKAGSTCDNYPACGQHGLGVKIGVAFYDFMMGYDTAIMDPYSPLYVDAKKAAEAAPKTGGKITLSPALAQKLTIQVQGTKAIAEEAAVLAEEQLQANAAAKKSSATKAAALSSAVLLGGGGFLMARRAAKKRRR